MKFEEALNLMREGKKVWLNKGRGKPQHYFYLESNPGGSVLMCHDLLMVDSGFLPKLDSFDILSDKWEEYKQPILDKEEKRYLENIIRPFRKRSCSIKLYNLGIGGFICVSIEGDRICLPEFKLGTMYKGMTPDHWYNIKELGLFEEDK